jgi:hypothetical protein
LASNDDDAGAPSLRQPRFAVDHRFSARYRWAVGDEIESLRLRIDALTASLRATLRQALPSVDVLAGDAGVGLNILAQLTAQANGPGAAHELVATWVQDLVFYRQLHVLTALANNNEPGKSAVAASACVKLRTEVQSLEERWAAVRRHLVPA